MFAEYYPAGLFPAVSPEAVEVAPAIQAERHAHTPVSLQRLALALRGRCSAMQSIPAPEILSQLGALHARWASPGSSERAEAVHAIHVATGYPEAVIDASLQSLFASMSATAMASWLQAGGIDPASLDRPTSSDTGVWVFGPRLTVVVSSGNVPGVALPSVVEALLLKSPCLVKTASAEPFLLPLYARSLAAQAPKIAAALAVTYWEGGRQDLEGPLLAEAEALIAYGSDATLQGLRAQLPIRARFLGYGHRISFTAIGRELLATKEQARNAAMEAAEDLGVFDQQGCYSPQVLYVETGGTLSPEAFAELLAEALAQQSSRILRRPITQTEAAAIHQYRAQIEMRGFSDSACRVWSSERGTDWTVALTPGGHLEPCVLNRTAVIVPLADLAELGEQLRNQERFLLSAVLGVSRERLPSVSEALAGAGVNRITPLGSAQAPVSPLFHDGVNAIAQLARFVTREWSE